MLVVKTVVGLPATADLRPIIPEETVDDVDDDDDDDDDAFNAPTVELTGLTVWLTDSTVVAMCCL